MVRFRAGKTNTDSCIVQQGVSGERIKKREWEEYQQAVWEEFFNWEERMERRSLKDPEGGG